MYTLLIQKPYVTPMEQEAVDNLMVDYIALIPAFLEEKIYGTEVFTEHLEELFNIGIIKSETGSINGYLEFNYKLNEDIDVINTVLNRWYNQHSFLRNLLFHTVEVGQRFANDIELRFYDSNYPY